MTKILEDGPAHRGTTLHKFVCQVQPYYWKPDVWELDRWFEWPPDIFALTSLLLSYTGAYRRAISPASDVWPKANWPQKAKAIAAEWRNSIAENRSLPEELQERRRILEANRDIMVDTLYDSNNDQKASHNPWEVCKVLLELHAIADEAMRGVGIIYSPRSSLLQEEQARREQSGSLFTKVSDEEGSHKEVSDNIAFFYLQANYLLALRGSLSRVPKYRGIVLPKSRTPQIGLSLRSLSNHLTFHQSEVDIAWRAFPWFNFDENTLNVMVVPWPYHIDATHFSPILHPKTQQELGPQRYFHYEPRAEPRLDVEKLVRLIDDARKEVRRIHLLVFPEMSLRRSDLKRLKNLLEERLKPHDMPMIIAGVSARLSDEGQDSAIDPHFAVGKGAAGFNRVILSAYYAEKWHDVIQDKHHRWRVDSQQIEQYNLGGALSGSRVWWEAIHIPRRRLSVLAANSWLTICPLICEDLARLEPVSDLIRGIGPTLVTAILLDGPQLRERWPARYASVLADDPGSSVLTLTALGMSRRSRPVGSAGPDSHQSAKDKSSVVALWKDQAKGWREIRVEDGEHAEPKVLIVSASWTTESTVDGRAEAESSAVFTYQGMYQPVDRQGGRQGQDTTAGTEPVTQSASDKPSPSDETRSRDLDAQRKRLKVLDMCELTLYTYYVDALVDSRTDPSFLRNWFDDTVRTRGGKVNWSKNKYSQLERELVELNQYSIQTRDSVPIELPSPHLMFAIDMVTEAVGSAMKKMGRTGLAQEEIREYWRQLTNEAEEMLGAVVRQINDWLNQQDGGSWEPTKKDKEHAIRMSKRLSGARVRKQKTEDIHVASYETGRIRLSTPLSILWSIHVRLATRRRYGTLQPDDASLLERIEKILEGESPKISGDYHQVYLKWKAACREQDERERGASSST